MPFYIQSSASSKSEVKDLYVQTSAGVKSPVQELWVQDTASTKKLVWQRKVSLFTAVGTNCVMTSPNGTTWTNRPCPSGYWTSVCYGNGRFVAVGSSCLMTSTDGVTWSAIGTQSSYWTSVCFSGSRFVAVASNGTYRVATSTDGVSWSYPAAPSYAWQSVCCTSGGVFLAVASNDTSNNQGGIVMYSSNGSYWSAATNLMKGNDCAWQSVIYAGSRFMAVAKNAITSGANRLAYTNSVSYNSASYWNRTEILSEKVSRWEALCYGGGYYVAVASTPASNNRYLAYATTPTNWTGLQINFGSALRDVCYGNGVFVTVADSGSTRIFSATSPAGTWYNRSSMQYALQAVCWSGE